MSETNEIKQDPLNHAPDQAETVLVLIDVINDLEFPGGENLLVHALPMAERLAAFKRRAKEAGIPVIYANDNFGRWRSDVRKLVRDSLDHDRRGRPMVELLQPDEDDYFILKPRHSAFYQTNLDILLKYLGAQALILAGVAGDICVLFTANDAYMREFRVIVPADCIASESAADNQQALALMERVLKADITPSTELDLTKQAEIW
ncbi:MAG: cysteine hydrolase [Caldilineaceae bacterium]|nr:cysteine hydrolase [Caldilineaceae bacterium]